MSGKLKLKKKNWQDWTGGGVCVDCHFSKVELGKMSEEWLINQLLTNQKISLITLSFFSIWNFDQLELTCNVRSCYN